MTKKRNLKYSQHLISYVDILGFRELVQEKPPNFISRAIRRVIETTAPDAQILKANRENYINFSDLIVHTVPIFSSSNKKNPEGLVFVEINSLGLAQAALIEEGLLLRGAITIGEIERTYGVLFGPGLISAYELEREHAQFPRIIVDPDVFEALKEIPLLRAHGYGEEMEYISKFVKRDDDGLIFIDYLGGMQDEGESGDYFAFLKVHKEFVEKNIGKFKEKRRVLAKYLWLKKYHNAVVQTRVPQDCQEELLVGGSDTTPEVSDLQQRLRIDDQEPSDDEL
ncbi:MAG: hypothetical protein WA639_13215 [Candidatus Acidiferrum sp.]